MMVAESAPVDRGGFSCFCEEIPLRLFAILASAVSRQAVQRFTRLPNVLHRRALVHVRHKRTIHLQCAQVQRHPLWRFEA